MNGMELVLGAGLTLLSLTGLCCGLCMLYARLLLPEGPQGIWAVVWTAGTAEGLELRVRSLMWLQECGVLHCRVVIADGGLDPEGRKVADRLLMRYPGVSLCGRDELAQRLEQT